MHVKYRFNRIKSCCLLLCCARWSLSSELLSPSLCVPFALVLLLFRCRSGGFLSLGCCEGTGELPPRMGSSHASLAQAAGAGPGVPSASSAGIASPSPGCSAKTTAVLGRRSPLVPALEAGGVFSEQNEFGATRAGVSLSMRSGQQCCSPSCRNARRHCWVTFQRPAALGPAV